jgi:oxidoreductase
MADSGSGSSSSPGLSAIVIGGTGAIGKYVILELLKNEQFNKVTLLARRKYMSPEAPNQEFTHEKLIQKIVDMDKLDDIKSEFAGHDKAFCCLGTTRKDAGSAENFRKIDYDLIVKFAILCKESNVPQIDVVSASGANANSWFLYPKTKGQADDAILDMNFQRCTIWRPGLLERGSDARPIESFLTAITFGMAGIPVQKVAAAMVKQSLVEKTGNQIIDGNSNIAKLA